MIDFLLSTVLWALPIYFILRLVLPGNTYVLLIAKYINLALIPVRKMVGRFAPRIFSLDVNYSPLLLWGAVLILKYLLRLLRIILL